MKKKTIGVLGLLNEFRDKSLISEQEYNTLAKEHLAPVEAFVQPSWQDVRNMFFQNGEGTFEVEPMNSANLCPTFYATLKAVHDYRLGFNQDISIQKRRAKFATTFRYAKEAVAKQLRVRDTDLAFVRNTSEGNNLLSKGFKRWENGEVLLWDENHPTNLGAWKLRQTINKRVKEFTLTDINFNQDDTRVERLIIGRILSAINAKTRLLSFTEVSNISGIRMPAKAIIEAVRKHEKNEYKRTNSEIHIHVDGAVSWGAINHNLTSLDCDSFSSSSHKWLMGPFETGIFYIKEERAIDFEISIYAYDGKVEIPPIPDIPKNAGRFELLGQRDDANLYALLTTIDQHNKINVDKEGDPDPSRIQKRIIELQEYLREKLDKLASEPNYSVKFLTPRSPTFSNGVTIFQIAYKGEILNHSNLNKYLYDGIPEKIRFAVADTGKSNYLRICPHIMNLEENIDAVTEEIKNFAEREQSNEMEIQDSKMSSINWQQNPY